MKTAKDLRATKGYQEFTDDLLKAYNELMERVSKGQRTFHLRAEFMLFVRTGKMLDPKWHVTLTKGSEEIPLPIDD